MKWQITLAILATLSASFAFAEDFKTINGKEYKDATLSRVEPDGIVLRTKSGISKVYFVELPKQAQERFHYDASKGNAYSAEQAEAMRQQQQATATSASKAGVMPDAIKPMTTSATATLWGSTRATNAGQLHRVGAICRDDSESGATGRGACSRHGGVRCWKYSDGTCH